MIAFTPGHSYRYEASEALLDAQRETAQFDEVIQILVDLVYDSRGSKQEKAVARLAALRETAQIAPMLSGMYRSTDATSQYRIARALVLGGMSEPINSENSGGVLARCSRRWTDKNALFLANRRKFLDSSLNYIENRCSDCETSGIIQAIEAFIMYESGRHLEAEKLLSKASSIDGCCSDVDLLIAYIWRAWGFPKKALSIAGQVLANPESSLVIKMFATDLVSRVVVNSTREMLIGAIERSQSDEFRFNAIDRLEDYLDHRSVSALGEVLRVSTHNHRIREAIINLLGKALFDESEEVILPFLNDEEAIVRAAAVNALNELGSQERFPEFLRALGDSNDQVRIAASQAIRENSVPISADSIGPVLLSDTSTEVQRNIATSMSLCELDEAKPYILETIARGVDFVREEALLSIQRIAVEGAVPVLVDELQSSDLNPSSKASIALSLAEFADKSIAKHLVPLLGEQSDEVAVAAIRGLGIQGFSAITERLCEIVTEDSGSEKTVSSIQSLGQIRDKSTISTLLDSLDHRNEEVRKSAVIALAGSGAPDAVQLLQDRFWNETSAEVRDAIVKYLSWMDSSRALEILPHALLDQSWRVRETSAGALSVLGDKTHTRVLNHALFDSDIDVRSSAVRALGLLGLDSPPEGLLLALRHQEHQVRTQAAMALGRIGAVSVAREIRNSVLNDLVNRRSGCLALSYLADKESTSYLEELLKVGGPSVKRGAAYCLARISPEIVLDALDDPFVARCMRLSRHSIHTQALHYAGSPELAAEVLLESSASILEARASKWTREFALLELIISSFELGYYPQCVKLLRDQIDFSPQNEVARLNLGIAYRVMEEDGLSEEMYRQSLELKPFGSVEIFNGLGILSYRKGDPDRAMEHFNRSLQLLFNPEEPISRYWKYEHDIHMLITALIGGGYGDFALQKLQQNIRVLKWNPGVVTELIWDAEQLNKAYPTLPSLQDIVSLLMNTQAELEEYPRGPLRSTTVSVDSY
jgi:HEAT repeat protein